MCSWFKFPSGNVTKRYTRCVWRRETRCSLTWQVDPAGGSVSHGLWRREEAAARPPPGRHWSFTPGAFSSLGSHTLSIKLVTAGEGGHLFVKAKDHRSSGGWGGSGPERSRPRRPCVCVCPACCYCPSRPHRCCCSVAASMIGAEDGHCAWPLRTPLSLPLTHKEGWEQREPGVMGRPGPSPPHGAARGSNTAGSPCEISVPTPEIKGLRTMTSTLLSVVFFRCCSQVCVLFLSVCGVCFIGFSTALSLDECCSLFKGTTRSD